MGNSSNKESKKAKPSTSWGEINPPIRPERSKPSTSNIALNPPIIPERSKPSTSNIALNPPIIPERSKPSTSNIALNPPIIPERSKPSTSIYVRNINNPPKSPDEDQFSDISMESNYSDISMEDELSKRMERLDIERPEVTDKIKFYAKMFSEELRPKTPEPEPEPEKAYVPEEVDVVLSEMLSAKKSKLKSNVVNLYSKGRSKTINAIWKYNNDLDSSGNWDELLCLDDSVLITLRIVKSLKEIKIADWEYLRSMFRTLKIASKSKIVFYKSAIASRLLRRSLLLKIYSLITHQNDVYSLSKVTADIIMYYEDIILYNDHILCHLDLLTSILNECRHYCDSSYTNRCSRLINKIENKKFDYLNIYPVNIFEKNQCFNNLENYDNIHHYVKTHVAFLKEDFEISLRKGLVNYINNKKDKENINKYENVKLCFSKYADNFDFYIQFNEEQICNLRKTHWPSSNKFYSGSLVLLSSDKFKTYFICRCGDRREIEKGSGRLPIVFSIVPSNIDFNAVYTMIEPTDYYDPYCSVMKNLKTKPKYYFPFQKYIVYGLNDVDPPLYLRNAVNFKIMGHYVKVDDINSYPDLDINIYQKRCLYEVLNKEICLIQGPPGTGKTFMCQLLIKVLLENQKIWSNSFNTPIVVVCYKNLSLDQLLNNLLKDDINILRLGTNTKYEELVNFYSLGGMEKPNESFTISWTYRFLRQKEKEVRTEIDEIISSLDQIDKKDGIIKFEKLEKTLKIKDIVYLKPIFIEWLFSLDKQSADSLDVLKTPEYEMIHPDKRDVQILEKELYIKMKNKMDNLFLWKKKISLEPDAETVTNADDKFSLYHLWVERFRESCKKELVRLTRLLMDIRGQFFETNRLVDARKIAQSNIQVMGMTTTAAARLDVMIEEIKPRILIVEEAAEVLESHCVAALSQYCEHLILLGDHKQLRPLARNAELERYSMTLSLFERLINNGINPSVLNRQYRMRPEISTLIAPAIYENLEDDESVKSFPDVLGMKKNVYFIDHRNEENKTYSTSSFYNRFEVDFTLNLSLYLIKQGYDASEITIIAMYGEQEKMLHRERASLKNDFPEMERVVIATVDSYQGKQNKIVLLSLVRNNKFGNIGFLNVINRVCVALSRAQHGLYIFGNMEMLRKKSGMWKSVDDKLKRQNAIGPNLTIVCKPHGSETVIKAADQLRLHLNGGCFQGCKAQLACGHTCTFQCHPVDSGHLSEFACIESCQEMLDCGHRCNSKCHNELSQHTCQYCLEDKSNEEIPEDKQDFKKSKRASKKTKTNKNDDSNNSDCPDVADINILANICEFKFDCGHECGRDCIEHNPELKCEKKCLKRLDCRHICKLECHPDIGHVGNYSCTAICNRMLKCGHICKNKCHLDRDKEHMIVNRCKRICGKLLGCGHQCGYECHVSVDDGHFADYACMTPCAKDLPCGHLCATDCHFKSPDKHSCTKCILFS